MFFMLALIGCLTDAPVAGDALRPDDAAGHRVWMFRHGSQGWVRENAPVAHSMSSLGLGSKDGRVVLTTQCFWGDCGSMLWRHLSGPPVHAISSADLQTWTPEMWRLVDPDDRVPIDTEFFFTEDGAQVWYYGAPAGQLGDPAAFGGTHTLYSATVQGDRLVNPVVRMTGPHLADPAPVMFRGALYVFATTKPGHEIAMATGEPLAISRTWRGVSVPHAMVVGDALWLWAHRVDAGRFVPVRAVSTDGKNWSTFEAVLPTAGVSCANPVGAVAVDGPVVFCVEEHPRAFTGQTPPGVQ